MKTSKLLHQLQTIIPIIAGSAIYAFGLMYFIIPNELMEGASPALPYCLTMPLTYRRPSQPWRSISRYSWSA